MRAGKGPTGLALGAGGGVDGDLGVGHLLAGDGEEAEAEAVLPRGEDHAGGRGDELVGGLRRGEELVERLALGGGEVGCRRRRLGRDVGAGCSSSPQPAAMSARSRTPASAGDREHGDLTRAGIAPS